MNATQMNIENAPQRNLVKLPCGTVARTRGFSRSGVLVDCSPKSIKERIKTIPRGTQVLVFVQS